MLAGATYGAAAIPDAWLTQLDRKVAEDIRSQVPALLELATRQTGSRQDRLQP
jgi:ADP-ribosyl-[dinitrogen reductase] hydrolase